MYGAEESAACIWIEEEIMSNIPQKVAVFIKPTEALTKPLKELIAILEGEGREVRVDEKSLKSLGEFDQPVYTRSELGQWCDLAVVLGGDGSMLGVAREISRFGKPLVGINAGRLGFITDLCLDNMNETLPAILNGEYVSDKRTMLEGWVERDGNVIFSSLAVNDIGISHGRAGGMVDFVVYVEGKQIASQLADGMICSTATGSTAYALASGGPILHPSLSGVVLVPVAPHTLSNRPIVLPSKMDVAIELMEARDAVAYFDMQEFCDILPGDVIHVKESGCCFEMWHPVGYDYFELLRMKLKWNFMPARALK